MRNINIKDSNKVCLFLAIFLIECSLFIYEVLLTRLFSVILTVNLVFLIVSFAILGSGIGGILSYKILNKRKRMKPKVLIVRACLLLIISVFISVTLIYNLKFIPIYTLYTFIGAIPFVLGGVVVTSIFSDNVSSSNKLYFMELLGAGVGAVLIIYLMNNFGFIRSVVAVLNLLILATIFIKHYYDKGKSKLVYFISLSLLAILFIEGNIANNIERNFNAYYTSPNTLMKYFESPESAYSNISFSKWDAISRTDVIEMEGKNEKVIITDGGAAAPIIKFDGNLKTIEYLKNAINYIPFYFGDNKDTLVIGSGGGKDVLFALLGESTKIDAVEINPATIEAVNKFEEFSGSIYNNEIVNVYNEDGRNFVKNTRKEYDNIYLSMVMTNAIENTMYSLSENYIYTYEAMEQYFDKLKNNGKLSFMMHNNGDLLKIVNLGIKVLLDRGVRPEDVTSYFTIVNGVDNNEKGTKEQGIKMPLVIFKKIPFDEKEIDKIKEITRIQNREIIHSVGGENEIYKLLKDKKLSYDELLEKIPFNTKPTSDNSPFFYNYSNSFPKEIQYVFLGISVIGFGVRKKYISGKQNKKKATYFMCLGLAYMLVEIPIIQKMILYFGNPSMAFSIMLFSILVSSGIGSLLSGNKIMKKATNESYEYLLFTSIIIVATQFILNKVIIMTNDFDSLLKVVIAIITVIPMGLFMGMPFPIGLRKLKVESKNDQIVPLMIGINGIFSVFGSVLAVMMSMKFGFNITIIAGAMVYFALYIVNKLDIDTLKY